MVRQDRFEYHEWDSGANARAEVLVRPRELAALSKPSVFH